MDSETRHEGHERSIATALSELQSAADCLDEVNHLVTNLPIPLGEAASTQLIDQVVSIRDQLARRAQEVGIALGSLALPQTHTPEPDARQSSPAPLAPPSPQRAEVQPPKSETPAEPPQLKVAKDRIKAEQQAAAGEVIAEVVDVHQYRLAGREIDLSGLSRREQAVGELLLAYPLGQRLVLQDVFAFTKTLGLSQSRVAIAVRNILHSGTPISRAIGRYYHFEDTPAQGFQIWLEIPADLTQPDKYGRGGDELSVVSEHKRLTPAEWDLVIMVTANDKGVLPPRQNYSTRQLQRVLQALAGKRELGADSAIENYYLLRTWVLGESAAEQLVAEERRSEKKEIIKIKQRVEVSQDWRDDARCRGGGPDLFYSTDSASRLRAKEFCALCPVHSPCLDYALVNEEEFGIWGGLNAHQRRNLLRTQAQNNTVKDRGQAVPGGAPEEFDL